MQKTARKGREFELLINIPAALVGSVRRLRKLRQLSLKAPAKKRISQNTILHNFTKATAVINTFIEHLKHCGFDLPKLCVEIFL